MAYSPNTTNLLGRRALVKIFAGTAASNIAGTAVGGGLASTPCLPETDAQLFARWREYLKLEIELNAVQDARDMMSWNARQAYPPKPDCIASSSWVKVIPSEIDADVDVCSATTDMKMGRQLAEQRIAEVKAWAQKCNEIDIRFGLPELEAAFKAAWERQWAAFARFVTTEATTLAGLAVRTSAIFYFEHKTQRAWRGVIADQEELEPEQQILLTLRRDLLRMAGLPDDFAMESAEGDGQ